MSIPTRDQLVGDMAALCRTVAIITRREALDEAKRGGRLIGGEPSELERHRDEMQRAIGAKLDAVFTEVERLRSLNR